MSHSKVSKSDSVGSSTLSRTDFLETTKVKIFDFLAELGEKDSKFHKWSLLFLEILGMSMVILFFIRFSCYQVLSFDSTSQTIFKYCTTSFFFFFFQLKIFFISVFIFIEPTDFLKGSIIEFTVVFVIAFGLICVILLLSIYLIFVQTSNEFLHFACFFSIRIVRTVLFIPLSDILIRPLFCDYFSGTFEWLQFSEFGDNNDGYISCLVFPYIFFYIFGIVGVIALYTFCALDILFFVDTLRNHKYFTACSDGRFQMVIFTCFSIVMFLHEIFASSGFDEFDSVNFLICSVVFMVLLIVYIRVLPFYNLLYSSIYGIYLSLVISITLSGSILLLVKSLFGLFSFFSFLIFPPITIFVLFIRYKITYKRFKSSIHYDLWFCRTAHDVAFISYLTKRPKSTILKLLKNPKFQKNKQLCVYLIGILIDEIDLAMQIQKHTRGLMDRQFYDVEYFLYYYAKRLSEKQFVGKEGSNKLVKKLKKITKYESLLRKLYRKLFGLLMEEKVPWSSFPSLITQIQANYKKCDDLYRECLKLYPSEEIYRKFGNFLIEFKNDKKNSELYFAEANILDQYSSVSASTTFSDVESYTSEKVGDARDGTISKNMDSSDSSIKSDSIDSSSGGMDMDSIESKDSKVARSVTSNISDMNKVHGYGFKRGKSVANSSQISEVEQMEKKVYETKFFVTRMVEFFILCVFLGGMGSIIGIFFLIFFLSSEFTNSLSVMNSCTNIRMKTVSIAHYARKLQISYYHEQHTPLLSERNSSFFYNRIQVSCDDLLSNTRWAYANGEGSYFTEWQRVITLKEKHGNDFHYQKISLYDGIILFSDKCKGVLRIGVDEYASNPMNSTVQYNDDNMFFLYVNARTLIDSVGVLMDNLINVEVYDSNMYGYYMVMVVSGFSMLLIVLIVLFIVLKCKQNRDLKILSLIDKKSMLIKYSYFGGNIKSNNLLITKQIPLINKFFYTSFVFIFGCLFVFLSFLIIVQLTLSEFRLRNSNYDQVTRTKSISRIIHKDIIDIFYRHDSVFTNDVIINELERGILEIQQIMEYIRFGNVELGLIGLDSYEYARAILYKDYCNEKEFDEYFEKLKCFSLNRMLLLYIESAEKIKEAVNDAMNENNSTVLHENVLIKLRNSDPFQLIILLDEGNSTLYSNYHEELGYLMSPFNKLVNAVGSSTDGWFQVIINASYILLILGIPMFCVIFGVIFYKIPNFVNENLLMVKKIILLMPKNILLKKHVFNFIMGYSSFQKTLKIENKINTNDTIDVLNNSSIPIVIFDKYLNITTMNNVSKQMFGVRSGIKVLNVSMILDKKSVKKIKFWLKKPTSIAFSDELVTSGFTSNTTETELSSKKKKLLTEKKSSFKFRVYTDISRNKNMCIAMFENVEDQRKKKILQLAEKKSEKTEALLRNILPLKIANAMKQIEDKNKIISVHKQVTAIFADIVNFTQWSSQMQPEEFVKTLNNLFSAFDDLSVEYSCEKVKTIGDAYFAVCGIPSYVPNHAEQAMKFGISLLEYMKVFNKENDTNIQIRIGIGSGKVVAGIIGKRKWTYDCWGKCINQASRMESLSSPGKLMVDRSTYEYVFDKFDFIEKFLNVKGVNAVVNAYIYCPKRDEECVEKLIGKEKVEVKEINEVKYDDSKFEGKKSEIIDLSND